MIFLNIEVEEKAKDFKKIQRRFQESKELRGDYPGKSTPQGAFHHINPPTSICYRYKIEVTENCILLGMHLWNCPAGALWNTPFAVAEKGDILYECN